MIKGLVRCEVFRDSCHCFGLGWRRKRRLRCFMLCIHRPIILPGEKNSLRWRSFKYIELLVELVENNNLCTIYSPPLPCPEPALRSLGLPQLTPAPLKLSVVRFLDLFFYEQGSNKGSATRLNSIKVPLRGGRLLIYIC